MGINTLFPRKYCSASKNLAAQPSCMSTVPPAARAARYNQRRCNAAASRPASNNAM